MSLRFWLQRVALFLLVSFSVMLFSTTALAADRVVLKYRIFSESIPVKDLSTLAETGEASMLLQANLALAQQDKEVVRRYLTTPIKINSVLLERLLDSPIGNVALDKISQAIHTPSGQDDRQALHSALINSIRSDGNLSLLNIIQHYPTDVVQVEGDKLESAYRQLSEIEGRLQNLRDKLS